MPKPVCVPCQRFFRPEKNGFYLTEGMPVGPNRPEPGTTEPEKWKPYKIWVGDKWRCHGCGTEIIVGYGASPIRIHHESDFEETRKALDADQFQVNDC